MKRTAVLGVLGVTLLLGAVAVLAACGSGSVSSPANGAAPVAQSYSGTWYLTDSSEDGVFNNNNGTLLLNQDGSGTFTFRNQGNSVPANWQLNDDGSVTLTVHGSRDVTGLFTAGGASGEMTGKIELVEFVLSRENPAKPINP